MLYVTVNLNSYDLTMAAPKLLILQCRGAKKNIINIKNNLKSIIIFLD